MNLYQIVSDTFFTPLNSPLKAIYWDCLNIIYHSYLTESSYGIDRDTLLSNLTDYFEGNSTQIYLEDETMVDARSKATTFLRKLREFGWVESEIGSDLKQRVTMPNHAVIMMQALRKIEEQNEMEYQSEVSAIYSLLTNEELRSRPYPQILKPVSERAMALFSGLKQLNTSIRKYIDTLTANQSAEEIMENFIVYHDEIGSKAYHRLKTSDNISRFRGTIVSRLKQFLTNRALLERTVQGYQTVENERDGEVAEEQVQILVHTLLDQFADYDTIMEEIDRKHNKYIRNAVERAKFLLTTSNDVEGKISTILQAIAQEISREKQGSLFEDTSEDVGSMFQIFPLGYLSSESLKTVPVFKKMTELDDVSDGGLLSPEERQKRKEAIRAKNESRFSRKNITAYVMQVLETQSRMQALDFPHQSSRDIIRLIYICAYSRSPKAPYVAKIRRNHPIEVNGFRFPDFEVRKRGK